MTARALVLASAGLLAAGCGTTKTSQPATTTAPALPPIVVESPAPGARVPPAFRVRGTASVFEATLVVAVERDGKALDRRTVTASEGAPGRGSFETTLHATPGRATVRAFSPSAADGTPQHEVDVDVDVTSR